jgi:hypothetical protein
LNKQILIAIAIVAVISVTVVGVVYAASQIVVQGNNTPEVTPLEPVASPEPTEPPTTYTLFVDVNTTTPYVGESITLSATLNPALANTEVLFYRVSPTNAFLGSSMTNTEGLATFTLPPILNTNPKIYTANCTLTLP